MAQLKTTYQVYVDPVGPHEVYEAKLKAIFPTVDFTVIPKADAIFPVVSAASIVAKVTRDVFMEVWTFDEVEGQLNFSSEFGSGYPSGELDSKCSYVIAILKCIRCPQTLER